MFYQMFLFISLLLFVSLALMQWLIELFFLLKKKNWKPADESMK